MSDSRIIENFHESVLAEIVSTLESSEAKARALADFASDAMADLSVAVGQPGFEDAVVATRNRIERRAAILIEDQTEETRQAWINGLGVALRFAAITLKGLA